MSRIAILYPGGLGAVLGRALIEAGDTAITCLSERSETTRRRALSNGFAVVPSLGEVARQSEIVISLVPPGAALETASRFAHSLEATRNLAGVLPIFVDANSVAPQTKLRIAEILAEVGVRCLDGAFFGPTNELGHNNLLALSGPDAVQVAPFLQRVVEVSHLGPTIGQASALKMSLTILTKALPALFLEIVCASASRNQLDSTLEMMRRLYPGIISFLERTLPTYPVYVERRKHELEEAASWLHEAGQSGCMTRSAVEVLARLQDAAIEPSSDWRFENLLSRVANSQLLHIN
jgi:3-hydroxyisobutyrate dehydrogenase-like beta-hydroxyacid dehydrogenase